MRVNNRRKTLTLVNGVAVARLGRDAPLSPGEYSVTAAFVGDGSLHERPVSHRRHAALSRDEALTPSRLQRRSSDNKFCVRATTWAGRDSTIAEIVTACRLSRQAR